jgi:hypothetical protein
LEKDDISKAGMIKSLYTVLKRFSNLRQDPVSISQCGYLPTRRFLRGDAERHCVSFDLLIVVQLQMWSSWLMIYYFEVFARSQIGADGPKMADNILILRFLRGSQSHTSNTGRPIRKIVDVFARWALSMFQEQTTRPDVRWPDLILLLSFCMEASSRVCCLKFVVFARPPTRLRKTSGFYERAETWVDMGKALSKPHCLVFHDTSNIQLHFN